MRVDLLHDGEDLDLDAPLPEQADALVTDLGLDVLLDVMAAGDRQVRAICRTVLLDGLDDAAAIGRRQGVVADALAVADTIVMLHAVVVAGLDQGRRSYSGLFRDAPDAIVRRAVERLRVYVEVLRRLRVDTAPVRSRVTSPPMRALLDLLATELDEAYLAGVEELLEELTFPRGLEYAARLGRGGQPAEMVLRRPRARGWLARSMERSGDGFELPERDDDAAAALGRLRDQALAGVAAVLGQASEDIEAFLHRLRDELAFLVGCVRLHGTLTARGVAICFPEPVGQGGVGQDGAAPDGVGPALCVRGLTDPALALAMELAEPVVGNDLDADGALLVLITGANQGGKSTLLRSLGTAQLLLRAGMFVTAEAYRGQVHGAVFTHFGREEDRDLQRGKLEEELHRMQWIAERIRPGDLLLANESFAATNEREGSELARQVFRAHLDVGVRVVAVTHLHDLAVSLVHTEAHRGVFLRAQREEGGERTYRILPGEPLPTSYGQDLYRRIFGVEPAG